MNITITLELSYSKTDSLQQSIMLRLTQDRKYRRIATGVRVEKKLQKF
jgi:hypothetical protein